MPGFNRKGPEGKGPMTGGGRGRCNPSNRSSFNRRGSFAGGTGRGRDLGAGRGQGRGAGFQYNDKTREEDFSQNE